MNRRKFMRTRNYLMTIPAVMAGAIPILVPEWRIALAQQVYGEPPTAAELLQGFASTPPQEAVSETIGIVCPSGKALPELKRDCDALVGAAKDNEPQTSTAIGQITIDQAGAPLDASLTSTGAQAQNIGARLSALRAGATGISIRGLGFNREGRYLSAEDLASLYRLNQGETGGAASSDVNFGRLGIFLNGNINTGDQDTTPNEGGYDFNTWGITGGVDYRFSDNFVLGGAFGYLNTETDLNAKGGGLDVDGYSLTLYGTYYQTSQFYLDGSLGYGWNDYEQHRNLDYNLDVPDGGVNQVLRADYDGDYFSMSLGGGYDLNRGALTFGPVSQLQYIDADVDGYSEQASNPNTNGSGWPTVINDQNYKSLTFSLGGQLSYAMSQSWGVLLPQARFEWVHEFKDDARIINGFFLQDTSQEIFSFATNKPDANYFNLGVGASAQFAQGRSAFFYYQSLLGYDNVTSNLFNLGIRWEF